MCIYAALDVKMYSCESQHSPKELKNLLVLSLVVFDNLSHQGGLGTLIMAIVYVCADIHMHSYNILSNVITSEI